MLTSDFFKEDHLDQMKLLTSPFCPMGHNLWLLVSWVAFINHPELMPLLTGSECILRIYLAQHSLQGDDDANIQSCIGVETYLPCLFYCWPMLLHRNTEHHKIAQSPSPPFERNSLGAHTQKPEFLQCLFLVASIVLSESTNYSHFLCTLSLLSDLLNATQVQLSQHPFLFIFLFSFNLHRFSQLFSKSQQHFPKHLVLIKSKTRTLFST